MTKNIPLKERLIFALDVPSPDQAKALVETLDDAVDFYKIGMQLFMAGGYFELLDWIVARDKKVFVDLKFFDVPQTVANAIDRLNDKGATFATVHGNDAMLEAAAGAATNPDLKILAVTVLTSLDQGDMKDLGFEVDIEQLVISRARRAVELGCAGVISSGHEAPKLREALGDNFLVVSPGIRPGFNREDKPTDDQKRIVDVATAFTNGADHIVVGRPIRDAPDPRAAAAGIQDTIADIFSAV